MSFDLHLQHFTAGQSAPVDPAPVAAVLARTRHTGPDEFNFYVIEFAGGVQVEFSARGLDGRQPLQGCAFHSRGTGPGLFEFVYEVARAGDFVIFNAQGDDSAESPLLILVSPGQVAELPTDLFGECTGRPVCTSGAMLERLLSAGYDGWGAYRDQVMRP